MATNENPSRPAWQQGRGYVLAYAVALTVIALWLLDAWALGDAPARRISAGPAALGSALSLVLVAWSSSAMRTVREVAERNDFGRLFNPHDSLDASLHAFAAMLRSCHVAEWCVVVLADAHSKPARLYTASPDSTKCAGLDPQLARALLALPPERAVLYEQPTLGLATASCSALDVVTMQAAAADHAQLSALANLLEAKSFVSLPLRSRGKTLGRVHLVSQQRRFRRREMRSLAQLMAQVGPLIENMQLVEQLTLTVAKQERRRISRDLHDSTVQPYIGLKLGLEALQRKLPANEPVAREVDELIAMAGEGISQLRQYVGRLKSDDERRQKREPLVQSVRFHAHRFSELYPIETSVVAEGEILVSSALHEELIQIVREGLSNVRRHTQARRARLELRSADGILSIDILNDRGAGMPETPRFNPRSISERARELGGRVTVGARDGETLVAVEIPL